MSSQLLHSDNTFEQLAPQTVGEHVSIRNVADKVVHNITVLGIAAYSGISMRHSSTQPVFWLLTK